MDEPLVAMESGMPDYGVAGYGFLCLPRAPQPTDAEQGLSLPPQAPRRSFRHKGRAQRSLDALTTQAAETGLEVWVVDG